MAWWKSLLEPFKRLTLKFWVTFLCSCAVAQGIEWLASRAAHETEPAASSLMEVTGLYQDLVTKAREPRVHYTTLITIDKRRDLRRIDNSNVCVERALLAAMLRRIAKVGAAAIVIDKYFDADICGTEDPGTLSLQKTVDRLRLGLPVVDGDPSLPPLPIIIGRQATEVDVGQRKRLDVTSYLENSLLLTTSATASQQGLCNVASDRRLLPLRWMVYRDEKSAQTGDVVEVDGLALAAARAYLPSFLERNERVSSLLASGRQPFIGFIQPADFDKRDLHFASEVVCGKRIRPDQDWTKCPADTAAPSYAHGRVVLIGEDDTSDLQPTIVGSMMGYYLQANYIEALLDDRFLTPVHPAFNVALSLILLTFMELILTLFHDSLWKSLFWVGVLGVGSMAVILQFIMYAKLYVDPSLVTATYVVLRLSHLAFSKVVTPHLRGAPPVQPPPGSPEESAATTLAEAKPKE